MPQEVVDSRVVSLYRVVEDDAVANVRLIVAKAMKALRSKFSPSVKESFVIPLLQKYIKDSDRDVRYFAQNALDSMK